MLEDEIKKRNIPKLVDENFSRDTWGERRRDIINIFKENVYGGQPESAKLMSVNIISDDKIAFAGKACHKRVELLFEINDDRFYLPADTLIPNKDEKLPMIIFYIK